MALVTKVLGKMALDLLGDWAVKMAGRQIGNLGEIPFVVSENVVRTLSDMKWSGSANYATHKRHAYSALTEFTGLAPDTFSFSMTLLRELGVEPMDEIKRLWKYLRTGEAVPLNIGSHAYGRYRWNVVSIESEIKYTDAAGDIRAAAVKVKLQEYLRQ